MGFRVQESRGQAGGGKLKRAQPLLQLSTKSAACLFLSQEEGWRGGGGAEGFVGCIKHQVPCDPKHIVDHTQRCCIINGAPRCANKPD